MQSSSKFIRKSGPVADIKKSALINDQKQLSKSVLKKRGSENMQKIYRRTSISKSDFNKVAKQFY